MKNIVFTGVLTEWLRVTIPHTTNERLEMPVVSTVSGVWVWFAQGWAKGWLVLESLGDAMKVVCSLPSRVSVWLAPFPASRGTWGHGSERGGGAGGRRGGSACVESSSARPTDFFSGGGCTTADCPLPDLSKLIRAPRCRNCGQALPDSGLCIACGANNRRYEVTESERAEKASRMRSPHGQCERCGSILTSRGYCWECKD